MLLLSTEEYLDKQKNFRHQKPKSG